jgi:hypothetical protein
MREMKWHIYNEKFPAQPLTWDGAALEFDTKEDAERFIASLPITKDNDGAYATEGILFYDGGYLNATSKIMEYDIDGEEILVEVIK